MSKRQLPVLVPAILLLLSLAACSPGGVAEQIIGGPPKEASETALKWVHEFNQHIGIEITSVEVAQTSHVELTPALEANGIEDIWCLTVRYAARNYGKDNWHDSMHYCVVYRKHGEQWKASCDIFETRYCP